MPLILGTQELGIGLWSEETLMATTLKLCASRQSIPFRTMSGQVSIFSVASLDLKILAVFNAQMFLLIHSTPVPSKLAGANAKKTLWKASAASLVTIAKTAAPLLQHALIRLLTTDTLALNRPAGVSATKAS
jgi:hypothetical protein